MRNRGADAYEGVYTESTEDDGSCLKQFPIYTSPRRVAGEDLTSSTFKCYLEPVDEALSDGTYGDVSFTTAQVQRLKEIFPTGVCDYALGDMGKPEDL